MTEWVKLLAAKLDRSAVPGAHMVEGEHRLLQVVLWPLHVCHDIPQCTHMMVYAYTHNKNVILGKKKKEFPVVVPTFRCVELMSLSWFSRAKL